MFSRYWLMWLYIGLTISLVVSLSGPMHFEKTTSGIVFGTIFTIVGSVLVAILPAYLVSIVLADIFPVNRKLSKAVSFSAYILAGMPSIILGIIGFLVFCSALGFGWSILSAMLTLTLLLYPTLVVAFTQMLKPLKNQYLCLSKSHGVTPLEFAFVVIPGFSKRKFLEIIVLGCATALSDTAAVMLTCGALTGFPDSIFDSVRLINYHIYLQAMEVPGGMPEAKSLSLSLVIALIVMLLIPKLAAHLYIAKVKN